MGLMVSIVVFLGLVVVLSIGVLSVLRDLLDRGPFLHSAPQEAGIDRGIASLDLRAERPAAEANGRAA